MFLQLFSVQKRSFFLATSIISSFIVFNSCGKYPTLKHDESSSEKIIPLAASSAEITGSGYVPLYLTGNYKQKNVDFEIKETLVDINAGYKYRAITYDGNFPAKTITVEQGTLVRIKIVNQLESEHSLHTHVIKYKPESDGTKSSATAAKGTRYYFWEVTSETPAGYYPFHDHGGPGEGAQSRGLVGMVHVVKPGELNTPSFGVLLHDIDANYLFSMNGTPVTSSGGAGHAGGHGGASNGAATEIPAHLINGKFGMQQENMFELLQGSTIPIGIVNLGENIHNFHPHGNFFTEENGRINDTLALQPGEFRTVLLKGETKGEWMYHCHVPGHPEGGMWSRYVVK